MARHGKADWELSDAAYDSIAALTIRYNELEDGKWRGMMDFQPRKLSVFNRVERTTATEPMKTERSAIRVWNAMECTSGNPAFCEGLGYEGKAAGINKGDVLTFDFEELKPDSVEVEIRLLPNHPVEGDKLRISVSLDGTEKTLSYETQGRSEEWKENVLWNQAVRKVAFPVQKGKKHRLTIKALDEGVVLDQVRLN